MQDQNELDVDTKSNMRSRGIPLPPEPADQPKAPITPTSPTSLSSAHNPVTPLLVVDPKGIPLFQQTSIPFHRKKNPHPT